MFKNKMPNIRTLFLQEFTKQLMLNSEKMSKTMGQRPIARRYIALVFDHSQNSTGEIKPLVTDEWNSDVSKISEIEVEKIKPEEQVKKIKKEFIPEQKPKKIYLNKPQTNIIRSLAPKPVELKRVKPIRPIPKIQLQTISPVIEPFKPKFQPEFRPDLTKDFDLGKLNILIKDPNVTSIECPGPGKFLLVRKIQEVNVTKITLSEQEIKDILNKFSEKAKIPVVGGIFRAGVGNMLIIALESEYVGTRFIIQKSSPSTHQIRIFG